MNKEQKIFLKQEYKFREQLIKKYEKSEEEVDKCLLERNKMKLQYLHEIIDCLLECENKRIEEVKWLWD